MNNELKADSGSVSKALQQTPCCTLPICLVSGGKDSQATAIWCLQNNVKPMFLFCDTEWEDIVTYEFVREFENKLGAEIVRLTSLGFVKLAVCSERCFHILKANSTSLSKTKLDTLFTPQQCITRSWKFSSPLLALI